MKRVNNNGHLPKCRNRKDPNCMAWSDSANMWSRYMESPSTRIWIMYCNFFFGVLPAVLFFSNSVYIASLQTEQVVETLPDLPNLDARSIARWFSYLFILFPLFISMFQLVHFNRFIGMRLIWTFFIGQMVGLLWYVLAVSPKICRKIGRLFHKKRVGSVFLLTSIILLAISSLVFVVYIYTPQLRSELHYKSWSYAPIL
jgi:hypothetical protein